MELSLNDLKQLIGGFTAEYFRLAEMLDRSKTNSFEVGKKYFIRCVTFYYTGRLVSITDTDLVLEDAAWIASTGRFHDCLKSGQFEEVEPFTENVIVPLGAIVDASIWNHELPRNQK